MELKPQPLGLSPISGETLHTIAAPEPKEFIIPLVYGTIERPISDEVIEPFHSPKELKLRGINDVLFLRNHVAISQESEVIKYTFLRGRWKHHGGVMRIKADAELYKIKNNTDLSVRIHVDEPVYWADSDKPDVYGHVLLETIPSLWGLDFFDKDIKVVTSTKRSRSYIRMFQAMGVHQDRIIHIDHPIFAKEAIFPSLPVVRRSWIHPKAWETFEKLKSIGKDGNAPRMDRIYLSRSKMVNADRPLLNENEIEGVFEEFGFSVIHPQELSIEDQIQVYSNAKMIAGCGGSATHNALFAPPDTKVLIVCSAGWLVNADMLLSQVKGRLGYVFGEPTTMRPTGHRTQSAWSVLGLEVRSAIKKHFDL